jgi:beta-galactosidase
LPHWNWEGREGEIPFSYIRTTTVLNFYKWQKHGVQKNMSTPQNRYRLMWMDVKYEPGTVKWWHDNGKAVKQKKCILLAIPNSFRTGKQLEPMAKIYLCNRICS